MAEAKQKTTTKGGSRRTSTKAATKKGGGDANGASPVTLERSRVEAFRRLAQAYADGACVMRPSQLTGHDRRLHVRETILEDHANRIDERAHDAREKFDKLAGSAFDFFRGTSLLFHRDMAGEDKRMPTVLLLGDVHPDNFGVMPNRDNVPIFGVNDFDDACYGPFTWDLKRGAAGFILAVEEEGGLGPKHQRKIARRFVEGYIEGMRYYAQSSTEGAEQLRPDNSPKVLRRLFDKAMKRRDKWLWKRYLDENGRGFRTSEELTPVSHRREEFQGHVDTLARRNGLRPRDRFGSLAVKDVAIRHGQGTASLGLPRFYVLLEGPAGDATDDLIVEFKQARRSALSGLVPEHGFDAGHEGERIAHGQAVHLAMGDVFYGTVEIDGLSFMSRERAPFRDDMDLDDLSKETWLEYAAVCGRALAQAHARSDDAGQIDYDVEPLILEAVEPVTLFVEDMLDFAEAAIERLKRDHAFFKRDREHGAFEHLLKSYR
ncbi:MAG: DUF2252 domain-containing protein [Paracoccaceae bacterium]